MFAKGSDSSILPLTNEQNPSITKALDSFAKKGYRTLLFAIRDLSGFSESNIKLCDEKTLEKEFKLLGATAVEDLL